jgi:hypothetical protein
MSRRIENPKEGIMEESLEKVRDLLKIQGQDGNWNHDTYMLGMYNGLELAVAIMDGREPVYRELPKE